MTSLGAPWVYLTKARVIRAAFRHLTGDRRYRPLRYSQSWVEVEKLRLLIGCDRVDDTDDVQLNDLIYLACIEEVYAEAEVD